MSSSKKLRKLRIERVELSNRRAENQMHWWGFFDAEMPRYS